MRSSKPWQRGRRLVAQVLAVTAAAMVVSTGSAEAAPVQRCRDQETWIRNLPYAELMNVKIDMCVASDGGNQRNAFVNNIWWEVESKFTSDNFYYFRFQARLERNDADYSVKKCDLTWHANHLRWPDANTPSMCSAGKITTSLRGGWTGDGYLEYDIVGDGEGRKTWQLTGSPVIN